MTRWGWGWVAGGAAALAAASALYSSGRAGERRGPAARPNPAAASPTIETRGGVLNVTTHAPAELLVIDSSLPTAPVRLLWFQGRAAVWTSRGAITIDAGGAPVRFDTRLRAERLRFRLEGREIASVAQNAAGRFWVSTRGGSVLALGEDGAVADSVPHPFDFSHLATDADGRVWAVRSPEQFAFPFRLEPEPLLAPVDHAQPFGVVARLPHVPLFQHLVNAGRVAFASDGSAFFAPFIRDEIVRVRRSGDTAWVARRGLPHGVDEPKFELDDRGKPQLDYAPVNLGLALGPDGMVYVLSTPGYTTSVGRLDVIDPDSGIVRRTAELPTPLPTLAVDSAGRVYLLDELALLTGVAPAEREPVAAFDLNRLGGGRVRLDDFAGRVLLINFWASWCEPCRLEMPALDTLAASFAGEPFAFVALSDDVEWANAATFIEEFGFTFPVGLGNGKLRNTFHYIGLPFTLLVDAQGRALHRWTGFAGPEQLAAIRAVIRTELDRMPEPPDAAMDMEHH